MMDDYEVSREDEHYSRQLRDMKEWSSNPLILDEITDPITDPYRYCIRGHMLARKGTKAISTVIFGDTNE